MLPIFCVLLAMLTSCDKYENGLELSSTGTLQANDASSLNVNKQQADNDLQTATFGAGCFWCVEAVFEMLTGVSKVESGYMGGRTENPDYRSICTGQTGHAEVVRIYYNPDRISFETLLSWFWRSHDPTTLNRQGADVGTQYRSVIFYESEEQKTAALASKLAAQESFADPIVTEITPMAIFYEAEDYHQGYFQANRTAPYCQFVIQPKLKKLELE